MTDHSPLRPLVAPAGSAWYQVPVPPPASAPMPVPAEPVPLDDPNPIQGTVPPPRKAPAPTPAPVPKYAARVRELFRSGIGLRSIAHRMANEGYATPNHEARWTAWLVMKALREFPAVRRRGRRPGARVTR
jgi:hypothetical protein